jgi:hypothetical protein
MIVFVTLFFQHTVWAEVATATDETDLVVAGKMIQQPQQNKSSTTLQHNKHLFYRKLPMIWLRVNPYVVYRL